MELPHLHHLLPHRAPMMLIDALTEVSDDAAVCSVTPQADNLFADDGRVPALITIEYMAQTVGAYAGLRHHQLGAAPRPGYLIAVRELTLHQPYVHIGEALRVHAKRIWNEGPAGQFEASVQRGGQTIASATLTVYEPPLNAQDQP